MVITGAIIYFIPDDLFDEYKIETINQEKVKEASYNFNSDLNNDGIAEKISYIYNDNAAGSIFMVSDIKEKEFKIWQAIGNDVSYVNSELKENKSIFDYDNNNLKEIYFLTTYKDSVYLNIYEPDKNLEDYNFIREIAICKFFVKNEKADVNLFDMNFFDINDDGYKEIVFVLHSGYSLQPRALFCYDIKNNILKRSPKTAIVIDAVQYIKEEKTLAICHTSATGNSISSKTAKLYENAKSQDSLDFYNVIKDYIYEYGDFASYTIAFDKDLNFKFKPVEYEGFNSRTYSVIHLKNIYSLITQYKDSSFVPRIEVINTNGDILETYSFPEFKSQHIYLIKIKNGFCIQTIDQVFIYDTSFNRKRVIDVPFLNYRFIADKTFDLNNDKNEEFIGYNDYEIIIYNEDLTEKVVLPLNYCGGGVKAFTIYDVDNTRYFNLTLGDTFFTFRYYKNHFFYYKYLLFLGIFIAIYLLLFFIAKVNSYRIKKENIKLEDTVKERTQQVREQNEELKVQSKELVVLNQNLYHQNEEITAQRDEIKKQKEIVETVHLEISESIDYATRLQEAILPEEKVLNKYLSEFFVLFKPKDKVSGDFYWWSHIDNYTIITAADSTGHGVPGAFMSMLGSSFLREIVQKGFVTDTGIILSKLRKEIIKSLKQKGEMGEQKDGMDMSIISINYETNVVQFSGANNPLYIITKRELSYFNPLAGFENFYEIKPDKMPIAIYEKMDDFKVHEIQLEKGDMLYMFSDGYADQFGGPKGKKFKYKPFKRLLSENRNKSMAEQKEILSKAFESWRGDLEQVDDVVILGVKL